MSSKVSEQIKILKELQAIDLQIRDIDKAKGDLPNRRNEIQAKSARERADIDVAKQQVGKNDDERRRLEKEIAFDREALQRFETRAQEVTSPDAFNAANRELETRKKAIKEKEDQIVRLMEEKDVLAKKAAQLEADFANVAKQYESEEKEIEAQNAQVDDKTKDLRAQRAEVAKSVERSLLSRYDQVFKRREGKAIVAVKGEVCQGCDMGVPPQIANFVRSGEQGVQTCPHCSRILFWEPADAPAEKPKRARKSSKKKGEDEDDSDDAGVAPR